MTTQPPSRPDDVYIAPPMAGDQLDDFAEPPKWPKVIGIISIIWGSLGLCCNVIGGAYYSVGQPALLKMAQEGPMADGIPPFMLQAHLPMVALCVLGLAVSVLLVIAGSTLAARKPAGRGLHLAYGVVGLLLVAISMYFQFQMQAQVDQWVRDNPTTAFAQQQQQAGIMKVVGPVLGVVLGFGWPVFSLVWFGLVKKDPNEITKGVGNPAA